MFTDKLIKSLKPADKPYRNFEGGSDKGFGIQVSKTAKTFFMQYQSPVTSKRRFIRLGIYPDTVLAKARKRCQEARDKVKVGIDPQIERDEHALKQLEAEQEAKKKAEIHKGTGTVTQLFEAYINSLKEKGKRSYNDVQQLFTKDIKAKIGAKKARDVTPEEVKHIVRTVYQRGAKVRANHARTYIMAAYSFGIRSDNDPAANTPILFRIEHNPARDIPVPSKVTPGERNLSPEQVTELWDRLNESNMEHASKTAIRLLLATGGQRVEEVLGMRWDELDFKRKLWELSPARTKNDKSHVVPLSDLAISLIKSMRPVASETMVFPKQNAPDMPMPHHSLSQAVRRFCNPPVGKDGKPKSNPFPKFVPKDIRRTVKSRMGELGISKEIRDRLQNHAQNDVSSKHYDRFDYLEPKQQAIQAWADWLEQIIIGDEKPTNVIAITKGKNQT